MNPIISDIKAEYAEAEGWPKTTPIPRDTALTWMRNPDLEVLGAMHRLLRYKNGMERIQPPLSFEDVFAFLTCYYRRCLEEAEENSISEWEEAEPGTFAAHQVIYWIGDLRADKSVTRPQLLQVKQWLEDLILNSPKAYAMMSGALNHLFQKRAMVKFFANWQEKPRLRALLPIQVQQQEKHAR